jgi:hypothetical protein
MATGARGAVGALGLNRLSRGRAHREWDRSQDQPAGEALWRHPVTRGRVLPDSGRLTDLPETSRPQPCCPLSLWQCLIRTQRPYAWPRFGTPQLSGRSDYGSRPCVSLEELLSAVPITGNAVVCSTICSRSTQRANSSVMNSVCSVRIVETTAHGWHTRPIARRKTPARVRAKSAGSLMKDARLLKCGQAAGSVGGRR